MMLFKLALANVKKSYREFSVYFLTLTIGISIFYIFNSLDSQNSMLELTKALKTLLSSMSVIMNTISVFVSIVLGFLVLYANSFLIRRRKKEFGIYLTLGMNRNRVAMILMFETLIVGLASLVCGILLGVALSHFMAIITANLFAIKIRNFTFVYSGIATIKTTIYFLAIFATVMIFNTVNISRLKLIALLNADKQNGKLRTKSIWSSLAIFAASIVILAISYYIAVTMDMMNDFNVVCIIGGIIGTFLFFYSVSGFILAIVKTNRKKYYRGLNVFVYRQLSSRINKTVFSTSFICLLLFLTLGALSSTSSLSEIFSEDVDLVSPYDASVVSLNDIESADVEIIENDLKRHGIFDNLEKYRTFLVYESQYPLNGIIDESLPNDLHLELIRLSDFNEVRDLRGMEEIELDDSQCYALSNVNAAMEGWGRLIESESIVLGGKSFEFKNAVVDDTALFNGYIASNIGTVVVPDSFIDKGVFKIKQFVVNGFYNGDAESKNASLIEGVADYNAEENSSYMVKYTKTGYINETLGLKMMLTYVGIYLGLIFLIASSTIIALIQLSEADENIKRYRLLNRLGASRRDMKLSILKSVGIGFATPLSLALVHSVFGVWVIINALNNFGDYDMISNVIYSMGFILAIYGSYFLITYSGAKRTIYKSIKES